MKKLSAEELAAEEECYVRESVAKIEADWATNRWIKKPIEPGAALRFHYFLEESREMTRRQNRSMFELIDEGIDQGIGSTWSAGMWALSFATILVPLWCANDLSTINWGPLIYAVYFRYITYLYTGVGSYIHHFF